MTDKEEREKVINDLELIKQSVADKELQESLTYAIESIKVDIFYDLMHEKITKCQQEPKTGHWIDTDEGFSPCECSECGRVEFVKNNHCPNCGAKMVKPQESED